MEPREPQARRVGPAGAGLQPAGPRQQDPGAATSPQSEWSLQGGPPVGRGQAGYPRTAGWPAFPWGAAGSCLTPTRPRDTRPAFPAQQLGKLSKTTNAVSQGTRHMHPAQGFTQRVCRVTSEGPLSLVTLMSAWAQRTEWGRLEVCGAGHAQWAPFDGGVSSAVQLWSF